MSARAARPGSISEDQHIALSKQQAAARDPIPIDLAGHHPSVDGANLDPTQLCNFAFGEKLFVRRSAARHSGSPRGLRSITFFHRELEGADVSMAAPGDDILLESYAAQLMLGRRPLNTPHGDAGVERVLIASRPLVAWSAAFLRSRAVNGIQLRG
jgi:hypothetical protein